MLRIAVPNKGSLAESAADMLREAGIPMVNIDHMFALPGQTLAEWQEDLDTTVALAPDGQISMESVSGDLTLVAPRDLSAQVSGESFSGDLRAPGAKIEREEYGPGSSFHTRYGAGKGKVRIATFSGAATLRLQ